MNMITVYGMSTCPDCRYVEEQIKGNQGYRTIDIGQDVRNLKAFLRLRDTCPSFEAARKSGSIGIPCFILEDGSVTLDPAEAGLKSAPVAEGQSCSIDGTGC